MIMMYVQKTASNCTFDYSAHSAFKDCLMEETKSCKCQEESCSDSEQATTFARSIVDNAIGFILNRCSKST